MYVIRSYNVLENNPSSLFDALQQIFDYDGDCITIYKH